MKPISLVIDGINSFYDRQEVNFDFDGLFCISGDTGSGKTTILDCIILALYGSGKRVSVLNDYINLRRDKAEVRLVFEADKHRYEVSRFLSRNSSSKARLVDLNSGVTIAEQTTQVNAAIAQIIGLSRDDFTQVVILEQGKFSKFLTASKQDRNLTVGNLFKLQKYKDLGQRFGGKAKSIKERMDMLSERLNELKEVTKAAVSDKEKEIKTSEKRLTELNKQAENLAEEISRMEQLKRVYDKCVEARLKLESARKEEDIVKAGLQNIALKAEETAKRLKETTERKAEYALIAERAAALKGLMDEADKREAALVDLRREWEDADGERKRLSEELELISANTEKLRLCLKDKLKEVLDLADFGEKGGYFDVFDIKSRAAKLISQYNAAKADYDEFDKKEKENDKRVLSDGNLLAVAMEKSKLLKDECDKLKAELAELKLRRENQRRLEAAAFIREGLSVGDICPVCGGTVGDVCTKTEHSIAPLIEQKEAEIAQKESEFANLEKSKSSLATRLEEGIKIRLETKNKLESCKARLNECTRIIKVPEKIDELTNLIDEAFELTNKLAEAESESKVHTEKLKAASSRADDVYKRGKSERAEFDRLKKSIAEKSVGIDIGSDEIEKTNSLVEELSKKNDELIGQKEKLSHTLAGIEASIKLYETDSAEMPEFDANALETKSKEAEKLKAERERLIASVASNQEQLLTLNKELERKRSLESEKTELSKKFDILSDILSLVKGDKFIEYIAEEYILQFTAAASVVLGDITCGKYSLDYSDGNFCVRDFLSGGMERSASTLSGGETFLASLSLAIAISREIARFKAYEFFFLDEGFGTLDAYSLDLVTNALISLSSDTLVGVVTHRTELTDRIFDKITVLAPEGGNGSVIVRSS